MPGARTMRPTAVLASALVRLATVLTAAVPGGYGGGGYGGGEGGGGDGDGGGGDGVGNEGSEAGVNVDVAVFPPTLAVGMPAGRPAPFQPMSAKAARLGDEGWVLLAASDARAAPFPPEIVQ